MKMKIYKIIPLTRLTYLFTLYKNYNFEYRGKYYVSPVSKSEKHLFSKGNKGVPKEIKVFK